MVFSSLFFHPRSKFVSCTFFSLPKSWNNCDKPLKNSKMANFSSKEIGSTGFWDESTQMIPVFLRNTHYKWIINQVKFLHNNFFYYYRIDDSSLASLYSVIYRQVNWNILEIFYKCFRNIFLYRLCMHQVCDTESSKQVAH